MLMIKARLLGQKLLKHNNSLIWKALIFLLSFTCVSVSATETSIWSASNESNNAQINHQAWHKILDTYLVDNDPSGVNLFNYASAAKKSSTALNIYINTLSRIDPRTYNKAEQKAYWINLYNALTVKLIIDNYPVKTITKLGESIFSFGPWGDNAITIAGEELSLNDIEHNILRPIYNDKRIHYAVNCASYSCPNLAASAFTSANMEQLLNQGACDYINHERAVNFEEENLVLSSIYKWYIEDFGGDIKPLINHLLSCAHPKLKTKLQAFLKNDGDVSYDYDWSLNETKRK